MSVLRHRSGRRVAAVSAGLAALGWTSPTPPAGASPGRGEETPMPFSLLSLRTLSSLPRRPALVPTGRSGLTRDTPRMAQARAQRWGVAFAVVVGAAALSMVATGGRADASQCSAPGGTSVGAAGVAAEVGPGTSAAVCEANGYPQGQPFEERVFVTPTSNGVTVGYTECSYCIGGWDTVGVTNASPSRLTVNQNDCVTDWMGNTSCSNKNLVDLAITPGQGASGYYGAVANGAGSSADSTFVAVANGGDAHGSWDYDHYYCYTAAATTGNASYCMATVSGTGRSTAWNEAVSGTGDASGNVAVAGGNATSSGGPMAVSATGNASGGQVNVAPLGHAG